MDMRDYCNLDDRLCKTCLEEDCSLSPMWGGCEREDAARRGADEPMTYWRYMDAAGWCEGCEYRKATAGAPSQVVWGRTAVAVVVTLIAVVVATLIAARAV